MKRDPQYQQETNGANLGAIAKYLAIPVPDSPTMRANVFRAFTTLLDENRYIGNSDPYQDNDTSQWHEAHYAFWIVDYILAGGDMKVAIIRDVKGAGVNGGTFTAGAWRQRDLNTLEATDSIVTVASNSITVAVAGKYMIRALAPASGVNYHQCRLTKNGTELALGTISLIGQIAGNTHSHVVWVGTLAVGDVIKLEHRCSVTYATYGLGAAIDATWGNTVFSIVEVVQFT